MPRCALPPSPGVFKVICLENNLVHWQMDILLSFVSLADHEVAKGWFGQHVYAGFGEGEAWEC